MGAHGETSPGDSVIVVRTVTVLLAVGAILHELQLARPPWSINGVITVAAVAALVHPGPRALVVLLGLFAAELVLELPRPFNHTAVLGIVGASILLWALVDRSDWTRDPDRFLHRVAPLLRATIVLTWALAFFAKLNRGFLEPASSCAVWILDNVPFLPLPTAFEGPAVWATLAVEGLVPVLLVVRRTRPVGVALAWSFHVVAALAGHTAFSGLALGLYIPFLDPAVVREGVRWARGLVPSRRVDLPATTWRALAAVAALGLVVAPLLFATLPGEWEARASRFAPTLLFLPWAAVVGLAAVVGASRAGRPVWSQGRLRPTHAVPALAIVLLLANAATPYLGLKNGWSLTMYSNLRTEPGSWNHLVVPEQVRLFDWQDDLRPVHDVDDPEAAGTLGVGWPVEAAAVPSLRVHRAATLHPEASIRTSPGGPWQPLAEAFPTPMGPVMLRLANVRSVPDRPECQV